MKRLSALVASFALSGCTFAVEHRPDGTEIVYETFGRTVKKGDISYHEDYNLNYASISIAGVRYGDAGRDGHVDFVILPDGTHKTAFSKDEQEINDTLFRRVKSDFFSKDLHNR